MLNRLPHFYGAIYITLHLVLAAGDKPPALRYTIERMLTSNYALSRKLDFPRIPHRESTYPTVPQSDDFVVTAPEVALQPVAQGDASKVGSANSCFAASNTPISKCLSSSFALSRKLDFHRIPHKRVPT